MAPPKPPPLETFVLKTLPWTAMALDRPWMAPPALLLARLFVKVQLITLTKERRLNTAPPP